MLQPCCTMESTLGTKSESDVDCARASWTPSSATALSRPAAAAWLKDWSSNPPASETMHARKSTVSVAPPVVASPDAVVASSSGAVPHAARASAAVAAMTPVKIFLFTDVLLQYGGAGSQFILRSTAWVQLA